MDMAVCGGLADMFWRRNIQESNMIGSNWIRKLLLTAYEIGFSRIWTLALTWFQPTFNLNMTFGFWLNMTWVYIFFYRNGHWQSKIWQAYCERKTPFAEPQTCGCVFADRSTVSTLISNPPARWDTSCYGVHIVAVQPWWIADSWITARICMSPWKIMRIVPAYVSRSSPDRHDAALNANVEVWRRLSRAMF